MTYKLPHPLDRPGQYEALEWILNSDKQFNILCAPTGFGKSPLAAACSIDFRTLALVLHKSLQSANYQEQYDFDILYGKSNYPCIEKNEKLDMQSSFLNMPRYTANDCDNFECECPYQLQELHCLASQRVSLNYAKFLMSKSFNERFNPYFLFLDEAHNLPDIVMNFVGLSLDWDNEFLQCQGSVEPKLKARMNYSEAMTVFRQCARAVEENKPVQSEDLKLWRKWKRINQKISITNAILTTGSLKDWYYETTDKSLIIKPLTAKYHFKRFFGADKVVLMSATITPNIAERLGLEDSEYNFMEVPNPWPVPTRLIYDLGAPAINWKSSEEDKEKQARLIASVLDEKVSGIIHVSSKSQAYLLRQRLYKAADSLDVDFHVPTIGIGTERQYQEWIEVRELGVYCISWNFHEGVDLGDDDINIMAKTPWPAIGSNYEKAQLEYDPQWYNEKTAYKIMQSFGRHQRGIDEHYNGSKRAYIADSSWHRLRTNLSSDFIRRIRKYNGK